MIRVTSSKEEQEPLLIVQRKTEVPANKPVIPDKGLEGVVTLPLPEIFVHVPVPTEGVLPASVALLEQMV